jgi:hypothetical protein
MTKSASVGVINLKDITGLKAFRGVLPGIEEEKILNSTLKRSSNPAKAKPQTKIVLPQNNKPQ